MRAAVLALVVLSLVGCMQRERVKGQDRDLVYTSVFVGFGLSWSFLRVDDDLEMKDGERGALELEAEAEIRGKKGSVRVNESETK